MMRMIAYVLLLIGLGCLCCCSRKELLDEKTNSDVFVPSTLDDFQALLENDYIMGETPNLGELSADNYYLAYTYWQSLNVKEHNAYMWAKDIYGGVGNVSDWNYPYQQVFYANVVLDGLNKVAITNSNATQWNTLKGWSLFIRSYAFYNVAQVFAPVYDEETKNVADLGIPLRLTPNVEEVSHRSTLEQTYIQILSDLELARSLLPDSVQSNLNRPSKPAALAMLARVHLSMRHYEQAGAYADSCLKLYNALIDYNNVSQTQSRPFEKTNVETMYRSWLLSTSSVLKGASIRDCYVDTALYQLYAGNDLRRIVLFSSTNPSYPKGNYTGTTSLFSGLATDETYLIRAECYARSGNLTAAMSDLNTLLQKRWKTGTFVPYTANTDAEAKSKILEERRKELPFRGLRWTDLRRLNKDNANITLYRVLNNQRDTLRPNSSLYVLPIPPDVIQLSGIKQNEREP